MPIPTASSSPLRKRRRDRVCCQTLSRYAAGVVQDVSVLPLSGTPLQADTTILDDDLKSSTVNTPWNGKMTQVLGRDPYPFAVPPGQSMSSHAASKQVSNSRDFSRRPFYQDVHRIFAQLCTDCRIAPRSRVAPEPRSSSRRGSQRPNPPNPAKGVSRCTSPEANQCAPRGCADTDRPARWRA